MAVAAPAFAAGAQKNESSRFKYVGGTENVRYECVGTLQILNDALAFRCESSLVTIPYRDIETLQDRSEVTRRVRKMKVRWTAIPPQRTGGSKNIYFTLIYRAAGAVHVLILEIPEDQMRPYLAEIDVDGAKAGRTACFDDLERLSDALNAIDGLLHALVEVLHAEADAVEA